MSTPVPCFNAFVLLQRNYDSELKMIQDSIQSKVVSLLSDPDNSVKMSLLRHSIIKLAVIFGKQKGL